MHHRRNEDSGARLEAGWNTRHENLRDRDVVFPGRMRGDGNSRNWKMDMHRERPHPNEKNADYMRQWEGAPIPAKGDKMGAQHVVPDSLVTQGSSNQYIYQRNAGPHPVFQQMQQSGDGHRFDTSSSGNKDRRFGQTKLNDYDWRLTHRYHYGSDRESSQIAHGQRGREGENQFDFKSGQRGHYGQYSVGRGTDRIDSDFHTNSLHDGPYSTFDQRYSGRIDSNQLQSHFDKTAPVWPNPVPYNNKAAEISNSFKKPTYFEQRGPERRNLEHRFEQFGHTHLEKQYLKKLDEDPLRENLGQSLKHYDKQFSDVSCTDQYHKPIAHRGVESGRLNLPLSKPEQRFPGDTSQEAHDSYYEISDLKQRHNDPVLTNYEHTNTVDSYDHTMKEFGQRGEIEFNIYKKPGSASFLQGWPNTANMNYSQQNKDITMIGNKESQNQRRQSFHPESHTFPQSINQTGSEIRHQRNSVNVIENQTGSCNIVPHCKTTCEGRGSVNRTQLNLDDKRQGSGNKMEVHSDVRRPEAVKQTKINVDNIRPGSGNKMEVHSHVRRQEPVKQTQINVDDKRRGSGKKNEVHSDAGRQEPVKRTQINVDDRRQCSGKKIEVHSDVGRQEPVKQTQINVDDKRQGSANKMDAHSNGGRQEPVKRTQINVDNKTQGSGNKKDAHNNDGRQEPVKGSQINVDNKRQGSGNKKDAHSNGGRQEPVKGSQINVDNKRQGSGNKIEVHSHIVKSKPDNRIHIKIKNKRLDDKERKPLNKEEMHASGDGCKVVNKSRDKCNDKGHKPHKKKQVDNYNLLRENASKGDVECEDKRQGSFNKAQVHSDTEKKRTPSKDQTLCDSVNQVHHENQVRNDDRKQESLKTCDVQSNKICDFSSDMNFDSNNFFIGANIHPTSDSLAHMVTPSMLDISVEMIPLPDEPPAPRPTDIAPRSQPPAMTQALNISCPSEKNTKMSVETSVHSCIKNQHSEQVEELIIPRSERSEICTFRVDGVDDTDNEKYNFSGITQVQKGKRDDTEGVDVMKPLLYDRSAPGNKVQNNLDWREQNYPFKPQFEFNKNLGAAIEVVQNIHKKHNESVVGQECGGQLSQKNCQNMHQQVETIEYHHQSFLPGKVNDQLPLPQDKYLRLEEPLGWDSGNRRVSAIQQETASMEKPAYFAGSRKRMSNTSNYLPFSRWGRPPINENIKSFERNGRMAQNHKFNYRGRPSRTCSQRGFYKPWHTGSARRNTGLYNDRNIKASFTRNVGYYEEQPQNRRLSGCGIATYNNYRPVALRNRNSLSSRQSTLGYFRPWNESFSNITQGHDVKVAPASQDLAFTAAKLNNLKANDKNFENDPMNTKDELSFSQNVRRPWSEKNTFCTRTCQPIADADILNPLPDRKEKETFQNRITVGRDTFIKPVPCDSSLFCKTDSHNTVDMLEGNGKESAIHDKRKMNNEFATFNSNRKKPKFFKMNPADKSLNKEVSEIRPSDRLNFGYKNLLTKGLVSHVASPVKTKTVKNTFSKEVRSADSTTKSDARSTQQLIQPLHQVKFTQFTIKDLKTSLCPSSVTKPVIDTKLSSLSSVALPAVNTTNKLLKDLKLDIPLKSSVEFQTLTRPQNRITTSKQGILASLEGKSKESLANKYPEIIKANAKFGSAKKLKAIIENLKKESSSKNLRSLLGAVKDKAKILEKRIEQNRMRKKESANTGTLGKSEMECLKSSKPKENRVNYKKIDVSRLQKLHPKLRHKLQKECCVEKLPKRIEEEELFSNVKVVVEKCNMDFLSEHGTVDVSQIPRRSSKRLALLRSKRDGNQLNQDKLQKEQKLGKTINKTKLKRSLEENQDKTTVVNFVNNNRQIDSIVVKQRLGEETPVIEKLQKSIASASTEKPSMVKKKVKSVGSLKRGKYVLTTPTTFQIKPRIPVAKSIKPDEVILSEEIKSKDDSLAIACLAAKKQILYRAMAFKSLSRDKTKPLVVPKKRSIENILSVKNVAEKGPGKENASVVEQQPVTAPVISLIEPFCLDTPSTTYQPERTELGSFAVQCIHVPIVSSTFYKSSNSQSSKVVRNAEEHLVGYIHSENLSSENGNTLVDTKHAKETGDSRYCSIANETELKCKGSVGNNEKSPFIDVERASSQENTPKLTIDEHFVNTDMETNINVSHDTGMNNETDLKINCDFEYGKKNGNFMENVYSLNKDINDSESARGEKVTHAYGLVTNQDNFYENRDSLINLDIDLRRDVHKEILDSRTGVTDLHESEIPYNTNRLDYDCDVNDRKMFGFCELDDENYFDKSVSQDVFCGIGIPLGKHCGMVNEPEIDDFKLSDDFKMQDKIMCGENNEDPVCDDNFLQGNVCCGDNFEDFLCAKTELEDTRCGDENIDSICDDLQNKRHCDVKVKDSVCDKIEVHDIITGENVADTAGVNDMIEEENQYCDDNVDMVYDENEMEDDRFCDENVKDMLSENNEIQDNKSNGCKVDDLRYDKMQDNMFYAQKVNIWKGSNGCENMVQDGKMCNEMFGIKNDTCTELSIGTELPFEPVDLYGDMNNKSNIQDGEETSAELWIKDNQVNVEHNLQDDEQYDKNETSVGQKHNTGYDKFEMEESGIDCPHYLQDEKQYDKNKMIVRQKHDTGYGKFEMEESGIDCPHYLQDEKQYDKNETSVRQKHNTGYGKFEMEESRINCPHYLQDEEQYDKNETSVGQKHGTGYDKFEMEESGIDCTHYLQDQEQYDKNEMSVRQKHDTGYGKFEMEESGIDCPHYLQDEKQYDKKETFVRQKHDTGYGKFEMEESGIDCPHYLQDEKQYEKNETSVRQKHDTEYGKFEMEESRINCPHYLQDEEHYDKNETSVRQKHDTGYDKFEMEESGIDCPHYMQDEEQYDKNETSVRQKHDTGYDKFEIEESEIDCPHYLQDEKHCDKNETIISQKHDTGYDESEIEESGIVYQCGMHGEEECDKNETSVEKKHDTGHDESEREESGIDNEHVMHDIKEANRNSSIQDTDPVGKIGSNGGYKSDMQNIDEKAGIHENLFENVSKENVDTASDISEVQNTVNRYRGLYYNSDVNFTEKSPRNENHLKEAESAKCKASTSRFKLHSPTNTSMVPALNKLDMHMKYLKVKQEMGDGYIPLLENLIPCLPVFPSIANMSHAQTYKLPFQSPIFRKNWTSESCTSACLSTSGRYSPTVEDFEQYKASQSRMVPITKDTSEAHEEDIHEQIVDVGFNIGAPEPDTTTCLIDLGSELGQFDNDKTNNSGNIEVSSALPLFDDQPLKHKNTLERVFSSASTVSATKDSFHRNEAFKDEVELSERNIFEDMIDGLMKDEVFLSSALDITARNDATDFNLKDICTVEERSSNEHGLAPTVGESSNELTQESISSLLVTDSRKTDVVSLNSGLQRNDTDVFKSARTPLRMRDFRKRRYQKRFPETLPRAKSQRMTYAEKGLYDSAKEFLGDFDKSLKRSCRENHKEIKVQKDEKLEENFDMLINPETGLIEAVKCEGKNIDSDVQKMNIKEKKHRLTDLNAISKEEQTVSSNPLNANVKSRSELKRRKLKKDAGEIEQSHNVNVKKITAKTSTFSPSSNITENETEKYKKECKLQSLKQMMNAKREKLKKIGNQKRMAMKSKNNVELQKEGDVKIKLPSIRIKNIKSGNSKSTFEIVKVKKQRLSTENREKRRKKPKLQLKTAATAASLVEENQMMRKPSKGTEYKLPIKCFKCRLCKIFLKTEHSLKLHYSQEHGTWCVRCRKQFTDEAARRNHVKRNHDQKIYCQACNVSFVWRNNYQRHNMSSLHKNNEKEVEKRLLNKQKGSKTAEKDYESENDVQIIGESREKVEIVISSQDEGASSQDECLLISKVDNKQTGHLNNTGTATNELKKTKGFRYCGTCCNYYKKLNQHRLTAKHKMAELAQKRGDNPNQNGRDVINQVQSIKASDVFDQSGVRQTGCGDAGATIQQSSTMANIPKIEMGVNLMQPATRTNRVYNLTNGLMSGNMERNHCSPVMLVKNVAMGLLPETNTQLAANSLDDHTVYPAWKNVDLTSGYNSNMTCKDAAEETSYSSPTDGCGDIYMLENLEPPAKFGGNSTVNEISFTQLLLSDDGENQSISETCDGLTNQSISEKCDGLTLEQNDLAYMDSVMCEDKVKAVTQTDEKCC